jgi:hypothetical protein
LRELADNAEASRLAELRRQLDDTTNTLAAHIGQVDDKLNRLQQRSDSSGPYLNCATAG